MQCLIKSIFTSVINLTYEKISSAGASKKRKFWNSFDFFHVDIIFVINFDLAITFEPLHFFYSVFMVDLHFS